MVEEDQVMKEEKVASLKEMDECLFELGECRCVEICIKSIQYSLSWNTL